MSLHVQAQLSAFMDGALSASEQTAVQDHLRTCRSCTRVLEELSAVEDAAREEPVDAPPGYFDGFAGRVRQRLEAEREPSRAWAVPGWTWAMAAVLVLSLGTALALRRMRFTPGSPADEPRIARVMAPREPARDAEVGRADPAAPPPEPTFGGPRGRMPMTTAPPMTVPPPTGAARATTPAVEADKDRASGHDTRTAAGAEPRLEAATLPAPAPADAPEFQEGKRELRDQKLAAAAAPREQGESAADAPLRKTDAPSSESGSAGGEIAPFAQAPGVGAPAQSASRRQGVGKAQRSEATAAPSPSAEAEFARLQQRTSPDLASARAAREAWRRFGLRYSESPRADEARVRTIAAGADAVRLGGDAADRELLEQDAAGYLQRDESKQKDRVRAILRESRP